MSRREEEKGGEDAMLLHNNVPTGSPVSGGLHGWQFRAPCGHGTVKGPALLCDWHCFVIGTAERQGTLCGLGELRE